MSDASASTPTPSPAPPATQSQRLVTEAIGTGVLVFIGISSSSSLAYGAILFTLVFAFGRISGGHFNPAVTVGVAMSGRLAWKDAAVTMAAQVVGGIVAGILLVLVQITGGNGVGIGDDRFGAPAFGDRGVGDLGPVLILELLVAFAFVLLVLAVTDERTEQPLLAPLAVGLAYVGATSVLLSASGSVANPAQALSTVFFSGGDAIVQVWLFLFIPLIGAALAGLVHPLAFGRAAEPVPGSGLNFSSGAAPAGYGASAQQWAPQGGYGQQGGYDQGGYPQAGYDQGSPSYGAQAAAQPQAEQPIIQDGWQWDPQAQQWIPAQQQQPPAQPQAPTWQAPGEGQTQVRPPEQ